MKIITADDDPIITEMLSDYLGTECGNEVICVSNGKELIAEVIKSKPDLIISDIDMPGIRGESVQAMVEMYPPMQGIPFIVITGTSKDVIYALGLSQNTIVLTKPIDFSALDAAILKATGRSK